MLLARRLAQMQDGSRHTVVSVLGRALCGWTPCWGWETRVGSENCPLVTNGRSGHRADERLGPFGHAPS